jgi:hypothetical protein
VILVTTGYIPRGFDAMTAWPFIFVRAESRSDRALVQHELVHYREQARWQAAYWLLLVCAQAAQWLTTGASLGWALLWVAAAAVPLWWFAYLLLPAFRLAAEVRAFRRQIEVGGISLAAAAHRLATQYRLDVTFPQAVNLLSEARNG